MKKRKKKIVGKRKKVKHELFQNCLYFVRIKEKITGVLLNIWKIGIADKGLDARIKELNKELIGFFGQGYECVVERYKYCINNHEMERYIKTKYAAYVCRGDEYFHFEDIRLVNEIIAYMEDPANRIDYKPGEYGYIKTIERDINEYQAMENNYICENDHMHWIRVRLNVEELKTYKKYGKRIRSQSDKYNEERKNIDYEEWEATEEWRVAKGMKIGHGDGLYEASNKGRIRDRETKRIIPQQMRSNTGNSLCVHLMGGDPEACYYVDYIIAMTFPNKYNIEGCTTVIHKDRNFMNNESDNLIISCVGARKHYDEYMKHRNKYTEEVVPMEP
jgi:hypothetical protein